MKTLFKRNLKNVDIAVIFLVVIFLMLFTLTIYKKYKTNEIFVINKTVIVRGVILTKDKYYVASSDEIKLEITNPYNVKYEVIFDNEDLIEKKDGKYYAKKNGETDFHIRLDDVNAYNGKIYIVKGLTVPKKSFDKSKDFVSCKDFTDEENKLLDEALFDRINTSGKNTRAAAVAASRFLTLEFDKRIAYFYENGRLNNHERKKVDGEGRYYHEGLYLSESKYKDLVVSWTGPGSWGCKIMQFEPAPQYGFKPLDKTPNGLDCSGFISWVLLNAGFDVKDTAAGDTARDDELYDLGEKKRLTQQLLNSGLVKVGDLIAYSGHMAIISGIDEDGNYYVAESLPNFKGVVLNKYSQTSLKNTFTHIMLMDSVYKEDGNLTNMWY